MSPGEEKQEKTTKKNDTTTAPNKKTETTTAAKKESDKNTTTAKSSGEKTTAAQNVTQETTDNAAGNEPSEEPATKKSGSLTLEVPDTYESNLQKLGAVTTDNPSEIYIYPVDFESKDRVIEIINEYNQKMTESGQDDKVITYTDYIGALLSSITKIINTVCSSCDVKFTHIVQCKALF